MSRTVRVLDHGFVHLRDSMPAIDSTQDGSRGFGAGDARIVEAARVSMAHIPVAVAEQLGLHIDWAAERGRTVEQDVKLINYLLKNKHTSPFEKVRFEWVAKVPITVARQWIRHRTGSFNEMSARYAELPNEFYLPSLARFQQQSTSNKQASGGMLPGADAVELQALMHAHHETSYAMYRKLLDRGLARETARNVLPPSIYTQWYWTVDLHNLFHFLQLRLHPHAQYEIRVYAEAMLGMIEQLVPAAVAAFREHILGDVA